MRKLEQKKSTQFECLMRKFFKQLTRGTFSSITNICSLFWSKHLDEDEDEIILLRWWTIMVVTEDNKDLDHRVMPE